MEDAFVSTILLSDDGVNLFVDIKPTINGIGICPRGYGDKTSADGHGCPLFLDFCDGKLSVIINADINIEEPVIISLEGAKESCRRVNLTFLEALEAAKNGKKIRHGDDGAVMQLSVGRLLRLDGEERPNLFYNHYTSDEWQIVED